MHWSHVSFALSHWYMKHLYSNTANVTLLPKHSGNATIPIAKWQLPWMQVECVVDNSVLWWVLIRSSDNDSTGFWPPGSLHTLGADHGYISQRNRLFMWVKIFCIEYILWGIPTVESTFDVANMVKTATVKDVPIKNDALLNIQAYWIHVWEIAICSLIW